MSYWNVFTNLYTAAISQAYRPVFSSSIKTLGSFSTTPLFTYANYYTPTFTAAYTPTFNFTFPKFFSSIGNRIKKAGKYIARLGSNIGNNIVSIARKYLGYNEKNGSYKKFTGGKSHAWCADFDSFVIKEAFRASGKNVPSGFGSSSVEGLRQWGIKNGCYLKTSGKSNKSQLIARNVKPGDLIIFKENGKSHTGIVSSIKNGKIYTIEGNTSNKVAERSYALTNSSISGFVQVA